MMQENVTMQNRLASISAILCLATISCAAFVLAQPAPQSSAGNAVPVTPDNFVRAETDMYFALFVKRGALGKFIHFRELPLEGTGVRPNRDTLYSEAVFDLNAGPVAVTLPDVGKRFMSMMVSDQDHYGREVSYDGRRCARRFWR
jgi:hypothetical protein